MSEPTEYPVRMRTTPASDYLEEVHGLKRAPNTLNKLACVGGGPAFRKAGARTRLYDRAELDRWAEEILGPEFTNSAESQRASKLAAA